MSAANRWPGLPHRERQHPKGRGRSANRQFTPNRECIRQPSERQTAHTWSRRQIPAVWEQIWATFWWFSLKNCKSMLTLSLAALKRSQLRLRLTHDNCCDSLAQSRYPPILEPLLRRLLGERDAMHVASGWAAHLHTALFWTTPRSWSRHAWRAATAGGL